jgi:hypothetical protein
MWIINPFDENGLSWRYIHPAGVGFRDEAERAEARIFGELWVSDLGPDSLE